jgi:hypothetical protein
MSKILIISDMHGSHNWEQAKSIVKEQKIDYVVSLGDWVDSWENKWPDQGENLQKALDWFREDTEHRFILFGNHCFSYITKTYNGQQVSGHQYEKQLEIQSILENNKDILHYCVEIDGWVFSHAGISTTWVNDYIKPIFHTIYDTDNKVWDEKEFDIKLLDDTLREYGTKYSKLNELIDWHGIWSGSGNEPEQGLLWIRPEALVKDMYYPRQAVGHTEWASGEPVRLKSKKGKLLVTDSRKHDLMYILDTEKELANQFFTIMEYAKRLKKIDKVINKILSTKIQDKSTIKEMFSEIGLSRKEIDAYYTQLSKREVE